MPNLFPPERLRHRADKSAQVWRALGRWRAPPHAKPMSTTTHLTALIRHENRQLVTVCGKLGVSVTTYKFARFVFRAVAIAAIVATAIYPEMSLPPVGYVTLGALALGPDVAEAYLTRDE